MYQEVFNHFIKRMKPFMKTQGFTSRGNNFHKRHPQENIGIINFQKSWSSNNEFGIKFTLNFGLYSKAIAELLDPTHIKLKPTVWDLHWGQRIGLLFPEKNDKWWVIDECTSMELLEKEIQECLLHKVIPEIDKCISNNRLIDLWISNQSPGTGLLYRQSVSFSSDYKSRIAKIIEKKHEKP